MNYEDLVERQRRQIIYRSSNYCVIICKANLTNEWNMLLLFDARLLFGGSQTQARDRDYYY
jgi:hypothetical protein